MRASTLLLALALAACGPDPGMHRVELGAVTLDVPADTWIRTTGGPVDGVSFEAREPASGQSATPTLTVVQGAMPEDRRVGTRVDARYWLDVSPLVDGSLGVVQRFDYRRYWVRVRSTWEVSPELAAGLAADTTTALRIPLALDLVRPLTYEVARIRVVRD